MPPDQDVDQPDPDDEQDIDYSTVDPTTLTDLPLLGARALKELADDEYGRSRSAQTTEAANAALGVMADLEKRSEAVYDIGELDPQDLEALAADHRHGGAVIATEYGRRADEERQAKEEAARIAALTDEQKEEAARITSAEEAEQKQQDEVQAIVDQTALGLEESPPPAAHVTFYLDADGHRTTDVTVGEGEDALHTNRLLPATRYVDGRRRAVEERTGLFAIKDLSDEVLDLPAGARADWWSKRSAVEVEILRTGFGLVPPLTHADFEGSEA